MPVNTDLVLITGIHPRVQWRCTRKPLIPSCLLPLLMALFIVSALTAVYADVTAPVEIGRTRLKLLDTYW